MCAGKSQFNISAWKRESQKLSSAQSVIETEGKTVGEIVGEVGSSVFGDVGDVEGAGEEKDDGGVVGEIVGEFVGENVYGASGALQLSQVTGHASWKTGKAQSSRLAASRPEQKLSSLHTAQI